MTKPLYIYGAGGLGREIRAMLLTMNAWHIAGFYDDGVKAGDVVAGVPCLGGLDALVALNKPTAVVLAIGSPIIKKKIAAALSTCDFISYPVLVHPSAQLLDASTIELQPGVVITAGCVLTTSIKVQHHVLINLNTTIGHDVAVGACSSLMPGVNVAGNVTVGNGVLIGSGASVLNGVPIGNDAIIGSGAVVTRNVREGSTVVGVPAREIERP